MITKLITKLLGDPDKKEIKEKQETIQLINAKEKEYQSLSDDELKSNTEMFRDRIKNGESLDDIMVEAFATVKNACRRLMGTKFLLGKNEMIWDMIPYDVQLIGGIVLYEGKIAEMKTGEGKTLVATLPLYLYGLTGEGAHLITVNDYLASRDADWMGVLYNYLGLRVDKIIHGLSPDQRKEAYEADIIYGTNNEFGFDYLRDNMATQLESRVQGQLNYCIVDEVDSILIDEARTPLIISAPAEESTKKYYQYSQLISQLKPEEHYVIDEKMRTATLTEEGIAKMEKLMGVENIYTEAGFMEVHHIEQALKAMAVFKRDIDYVVNDGEIIIVDEFTGRLMPGRRYSDGLHQAIEAKESVDVKRESKTLATITFQNFFRLYRILSGMTGTAKTEAEEFFRIYGLETVAIPTNKPITRIDSPDFIYKNEQAKFLAITKSVKELNKKGQPILIGTISVERSELLSKLFTTNAIEHKVLNAKHHEHEAEIVANAGQRGSVTIATNMAGRGTDIKLGEDVKELGGLVIVGSERHESRRIDNQLRGRSGRQGDPGLSRFYVSMDDDLMRLFGSDRIKGMMEKLGLPDDMPIENRMISRSIEHAQKRVEGHNFDIRKHILEYDDVMNKHREIIYARRLKVLESADLKDDLLELMSREVQQLVEIHTAAVDRLDWDLPGIADAFNVLLPQDANKVDVADIEKLDDTNDLSAFLTNILHQEHKKIEDSLPDPQILREIERSIMLRTVDTLWMEHIDQMTHLRDSVALRGYAQRDPLMEYKKEAFEMFSKLLSSIQKNVINTFFKVHILPDAPSPFAQRQMPERLQTNEDQIQSNVVESSLAQAKLPVERPEAGLPTASQAVAQRISTSQPKPSVPEVGRNEPCPCGSGKKYKKCHGA